MKRNKILLAVLVVLALLFMVTNYAKKHRKTAFRAEVAKIDSSQVNKIVLSPPVGHSEGQIALTKAAEGWGVSQNGIESMADQTAVRSALGQLQQIKTEQLVAKTKEKWPLYELTDSLAQKVEIHEGGGKKTTTLYFGKTNYRQAPGQQYGGQPNIQSTTYLRFNDDPRTYTIKGQMAGAFGRNFNAWRNSDFLKLKKDLVTQLNFNYRDGSGFSLTKKDTVWTMAGQAVDSTQVANYLNLLRNQSSSGFADHFSPKGAAFSSLAIKGASVPDHVVTAYKDTIDNTYYLNSSQHPNVFVKSDSTGLFKRLFVGQKHFMPRE